MTFSGKLQKLRKDSNLSQEQLASKLGVSRQAISKWELGTLPDINNLVKISNFFDCSLDYLMNNDTDTNQKEKSTENDENLPKKEPINHVPMIHKINLQLLLPVVLMTISIISLIVLKILSIMYPSPITRQTESGIWYTGFIGYIDYHNLHGILNILFTVFMISFSVLFLSFFIKSMKFGRKVLPALMGYIMIMIFLIVVLYELNTSAFVSKSLVEIILSVIYIAFAVFLLLSRNKKQL